MTTISALSAQLCVGFSYSKRRKDRDMFCLPHVECVSIQFNFLKVEYNINIFIYLFMKVIF